MDNDDILRRSAEMGLSRLASDHPADLRKALMNGAGLSEKLPRDLNWSEEPSHIFDLVRRHVASRSGGE